MEVFGPYQVLTRPMTLQPKDLKPPPEAGAIAWWKLDEAEGAVAADASSRTNAARLCGAARWAPGQGHRGGALELDGTKSYADCGYASDFDCPSGLTVSLWFKSRGLDKGTRTLIAKGGDAWRIQSRGEKGELVFAVNGPQGTGKDKNKPPRVQTKRGVADGRWHHVVGVYDGQRVAVYLDGVLEDSVAASGPLTVNTDALWLGNNPAARGETFQGWLDDVRLYGRGLNEKELASLANGEEISSR